MSWLEVPSGGTLRITHEVAGWDGAGTTRSQMAKDSTMTTRPKRYARFCGIDIGKRKHVACILDADGQFGLRPQSFLNDAAGYEHLLGRLDQADGPRRVLVAMEATAHYWYGLHDFLRRRGYDVAVLNPIQTAQQARKAIRKRKTDKTDARHIATLIKNGEHRPTLVPGELGMTCRQLTRLWWALKKHAARTKQLLRSRLHPVWPEYETYFANPFCATGRKLLHAAPTPPDLLAIAPDGLAELLRKASRGKLGVRLAHAIRHSTEHSVGMRRALDGARIGIRILLAQLDALRPIRQQLEDQIQSLADQLPGYLLTVPGAAPLRTVSLFGETDPFEAFPSPTQLVAFAGLDLTVFQTGQYDAPRRHISKRGSPFLRRTLWAMAHQAVRFEGDLRDYYLRRRRDGLHHLAAVTAVAIKLCRVVWRIMTDKRDYHPDGPPGHS